MRLYARQWKADGELKAVVCLIHGLGEHSGRYEHLARCLNRVGCAVLAMDLRGHGRSDGGRGHIGNYATLMADISCLVREARVRYPDPPLFLYGHSMGGNLVLNWNLRQGEHPSVPLRGMIASAPLLRTAFDPPVWRRILGRTLCLLWPAMSMSSGLEIAGLSRDPEIVRAYRDDPMVHDRVTPRFLDVLAAGKWAVEHAPALANPLLLMHGEADRITSSRASAEFAARAGRCCTLRIWKGLYHEIHNEPEKEELLRYVADWLMGLCEEHR